MLIIFDSSTLPQPQQIHTPFGSVSYRIQGEIGFLARPVNLTPYYHPPALAYAAKALGATRVLIIARDTMATEPTLPSDYVEFTNGRFTTFFAKIGTGYVQQDPPFCPEMCAALLSTGVVEGASLLVVEHQPKPTVQRWWQAQGITLITTLTQPEGALCRELELCVAVLALPAKIHLDPLVTAVQSYLPATRACTCKHTMAFAKKIGKLSMDWREWPICSRHKENLS